MLSSHIVKAASLLFRQTAPAQQLRRMIHFRKMLPGVGGTSGTQITSRWQKMCPQNVVPAHFLQTFPLSGRGHAIMESTPYFEQGQERDYGQKRTFPGKAAGFSLGFLGFLWANEALTPEEENLLVLKLKMAIEAVLDGKPKVAENLWKEVWKMSEDWQNGPSDELERLFILLQLALSDKMGMDLSEDSFLEICTKIAKSEDIPMSDRTLDSIRAGYQYFEGTQRDMIDQAIKDKNGFKLVAVFLEICTRTVTIMGSIEEEENDRLKTEAKEKEALKEKGRNLIEISSDKGQGQGDHSIMAAEAESDGESLEGDTTSISKDELDPEQVEPNPC